MIHLKYNVNLNVDKNCFSSYNMNKEMSIYYRQIFRMGGVQMATVPTQVRIDENLKKQATELFSQLGMDMSGAMNIFLRQCVMRGGLPFDVVVPQYKPEVIEAMEEAKRISKDPNTKRYSSFSDAMEVLD